MKALDPQERQGYLNFVLMPFSESFVDIYEVGIKPACKEAGAYCERVDEQFRVPDFLGAVLVRRSHAAH